VKDLQHGTNLFEAMRIDATTGECVLIMCIDKSKQPGKPSLWRP